MANATGFNTPPIAGGLPVDAENGVATWTQPWSNWLTRAWQILFAAQQSGTTAQRPTSPLWTGRPYWDTTLGKPIWWNGTGWVDATGSSV